MKARRKYVGIEELARTADMSMSDVKRMFSAIVLLLRKHPEVRVRGFGRFSTREYAPRTLKLNDQMIDVRGHRILHFNSSRQANKALSAKGGSS